MKKAIYGFSGDPITYGHIDIIKRALAIFGELTVGIGMNPTKKYFFNLEERKNMAVEALKHLPNLEVIAFRGLLVDYAFEHDIKTVIRGIRNSEDLNYELMLHQVGESQRQDIDTVYFPARQNLMHISSGAAKALQLEQGLIHEYVPLNVKQQLEERLSRQRIFAVTGEIGVGKSYVCKQLKQMGEDQGVPVHVINIDRIGHQILGELTEPLYVKFREQVATKFGVSLIQPNNFINRKELGRIIFNNRDKLNEFNNLLYKPLLLKLRRELYGKRGIILLDTALITESKMSYLSNNNVILVSADKSIQAQRLQNRGYSQAQIDSRMNSQYNFDLKKQMVESCIQEDHYGQLFSIDNSTETELISLKELFDQLASGLEKS